ncbi:MAG: flagellar filament capping protein FliD [Planctomycetota bacterium]
MVGINGIDGLISGIPAGDIIDSMIDVASAPIRLLQNKKEMAELRLQATQNLNLRMVDMDLSLFALKRSSTFAAKTASSSDEAVFTASAFSRAAAGTYQVDVQQLAQAHRLSTTASVGDRTAESYSGTITVDQGGISTDIAIDEASSLEDVATAITSSDAGLEASIINAGTSDLPDYRLLIQAEETGAGSAFTVSGSTGGNLDTLFSGTSILEQGQDSAVAVTIGSTSTITATGTSSTNELTDVVDGVTISAVSVGTGTLTIDNDTDVAQEAVTGFVSSLNAGLTYFRDNAGYDEETQEAGIFFSDSPLRFGIEGLVRDFIAGRDDGTGTYRSPAELGISYDEDTRLFTVDEEALASALQHDPQAVEDLFVDSGFAARIDSRIAGFTDSVDGSLATKQDSLTESIKGMSERISELNERLELRRARYEAEFLAMEKLMGQFQTQESFLAGQVEAFKNLAAATIGGRS